MHRLLRLGSPRRTVKIPGFTACRHVSHGAHSQARIPVSTLLQELRAFAAREAGHSVDSRRNLNEALCSVDFPKDFSADCGDVLLEKKVALVASDKFAFSCTGCGACCRSFSDTVQVDAADAAAMSTELARQAGAASTAAVPSALVAKASAFRQEVGFFSTAALPRGAQAVSLAGQAFLPPQLQGLSVHLVHVETFDVASSAGGAAAWVEGAEEGDATAATAASEAPSIFDAAAGAGAGATSRSSDGFGGALTSRALAQAAAEDDVSSGSAGKGKGKRPFVWTTGWAVGPLPEPLTLCLTGGLAPIVYLQSRSVKAKEAEGAQAKDGLQPQSAAGSEPVAAPRARPRRRRASAGPTEAAAAPPEPEPAPQPVVIIAGADDADRVCPFAVPGPRHAPPASAPAAPRGTALTAAAPSPTAGLRCSLGGRGMPYTCALYPLGDMWARQVAGMGQVTGQGRGSGRGRGQQMSVAQRRRESSAESMFGAAGGLQDGDEQEDEDGGEEEEEQLYYALDHKRCEGVAQVQAQVQAQAQAQAGDADSVTAGDGDQAAAAHQPFAAAAPPLASVAAYRSAPHRQLGERRARAEWFRRMATTVAVLQVDQRLASAAEAAAAAAGELAYAEALLQARTARAAIGATGGGEHEHSDALALTAAAASEESIFGLSQTSVAAAGMPAAGGDAAAVLGMLLSGLRTRGLASAAAAAAPSPSTGSDAATAAAAAPSPSLTLTADGCSSFALDLLAQAWYFHEHGLQPAPASGGTGTGTGTGAASSSEVSQWRQWQRSVEACTAAALAHLHAAATALQAAAAEWESRALAKRVRARTLALESGEGVGSGERDESSSSSSGTRGRSAGRRRARASSSSSGSGSAGRDEASELPPKTRREASAHGAMIAQQLAARLLTTPSASLR